MIVLERRIAQQFRAALRRCVDGPAARADEIPVLIRNGKNGILMHARHPDFAVMYSQPGPAGKDVIAFPASALSLIEGRTPEPVKLVPVAVGKGSIHWTEQGAHKEADFPTLEPESVPAPPELPREFAPLPAHFLAAFHEASLSTAKQPTKYVLNRVLLRGKTGAIVGSDSKQMLVQGGYRFPFKQDVLIQRSGVFGLQPFQMADEVAIGRTDTHVAIRLGRWIFAFTIDTEGRFPEMTGLIPLSSAATTRFHLDPDDAEFFLRALVKRLKDPAAKDLLSLTLDLTETPCFRFRLDEKVTEMALPRSRVTGKGVRLSLDLKQFLRAVELRFQEFEIREPKNPVVARDGERVFLTMPCSPHDALPPSADAIRLSPLDELTPPPSPEEVSPLPAAERTSGEPLVPVDSPILPVAAVMVPANGILMRREQEPIDVLAEVEGFATAVVRAANHAGRILRFLQGVCTQSNVAQVAQVVRSSLQPLIDKIPSTSETTP